MTVWDELFLETAEGPVVEAIELALRAPSLPSEIQNQLLNLAGFMELQDKVSSCGSVFFIILLRVFRFTALRWCSRGCVFFFSFSTCAFDFGFDHKRRRFLKRGGCTAFVCDGAYVCGQLFFFSLSGNVGILFCFLNCFGICGILDLLSHVRGFFCLLLPVQIVLR